MLKSKTLLTAALVCSGWNILTAQTVYDMVDPANQNASLLYGTTSDAKKPHYLMKFFNTGTVNLSTGSKLVNLPINYDPFTDNVITKKDGKDFILDRKSVTDFSLFDVTTSTTLNFIKMTDESSTFFAEQLLQCEDFMLIKKNIKRLKTSTPDVGYGSDSFKNSDSFIDQSVFYVKSKDKLLLVNKKNKELEDFLHQIDSSNLNWQKLSKLKTNTNNQSAVVSYFKLFCK